MQAEGKNVRRLFRLSEAASPETAFQPSLCTVLQCHSALLPRPKKNSARLPAIKHRVDRRIITVLCERANSASYSQTAVSTWLKYCKCSSQSLSQLRGHTFEKVFLHRFATECSITKSTIRHASTLHCRDAGAEGPLNGGFRALFRSAGLLHLF